MGRSAWRGPPLYRVSTLLLLRMIWQPQTRCSKASASQHIFLVVRNPQSARKLVEGGVPIDKLCIGNMHVGPGKEVTGDVHVYMDEKDKEDLRAIRAKGVDVYIQIAPGDHKLDFDK